MGDARAAPRVLIVEDNESDYLLLFRRVQKLLAPVSCDWAAARGELMAALAYPLDLIITDFHLLDIEGQELLDTLAAAQPNTPCLVLSGTLQDLHDAVGGNVFQVLEKGDYAGLQAALLGDWKK